MMSVAFTLDAASPKICQSCGMPLTRDEGFGTNCDGGKNEEYCLFCFVDGHFTDEGITLEQKIAKNVQIATGMDIPEAQARQMAERVLPTLKRWRST